MANEADRVAAAMRRYLEEANREGLVPVAWHLSDSVAQSISVGGARLATLKGLKVVIHEGWSWGWMMTVKRHKYDYDSGAFFWTPRRDSDANLAEDRASGLSGEAVAARAEGIAR